MFRPTGDNSKRMITTKAGARIGTLFITLMVGAAWAAESTQNRTAIPTQRPTSTKSGSARGPLPDPILLDGSTHPAEKKSEYGMIGDFELPGDENAAKNGKVGGGPQSQGQPGQQGQGGGGPQMSLPQAGGAGQQQAGKSGAASQGGAEQKQGPQNANAAGGQIEGAGDPNAKPEGQQVAQLSGEASGNQAGGAGEKPPAVAIGDSAMRIQTNAPSPGVVGAQQQANPNTQQHDKGTGTGGKGPTGGPGNNRVEKGRTIPAGL
jgi:hypothetical protein